MHEHIVEPILASEAEITELVDSIPANDSHELDETGRELLAGEESRERARTVVGMIRGLRRASLQIKANKEFLAVIKGDYEHDNKQLQERISKLQHLVAMFIKEQEKAGGAKSFDVPHVGRVAATKVAAGWKITDPRQTREWLEEQELLRPEFQSWSLLAGATQDAMDELIAEAGDEQPPGVQWVDEHDSISFRAA